MKGFFGLGCEGISKPMNVGALMRTAHAFDASFCFTIGAATTTAQFGSSDTSEAARSVPFYAFADVDSMMLPRGCALVGIELMADSVELPSFRHPRQAAYVLGSERGGLSEAVLARCDHVVQIPTRFSLNLAVAGAIVLYDRLITLGRFPARPVMPGGPQAPLPPHVHGRPIFRNPRGTTEPDGGA